MVAPTSPSPQAPSGPPSGSTSVSAAAQVIKREIEDEMKESFLDYAMSVIVARALPDVRDGLKPVQRRVLYSMHAMGLLHSKSFKKCARIVGDCMGKYHPHGDSSIYEALVRLAQPFSLRHPLVDGQGNFGCFTADTKVRLTDGRNVSFSDLVDEWNKGKKNHTFTVDEEGKIKIAEIKHPRKTKENAELVKITLDNGEEIKCTLNHLFLLKDNSYKEAQHLEEGDSLMPLYARYSTVSDDISAVGYEMIYQPRLEDWFFTHYLADEFNIENEVYALNAGRVRHHKDFNKLNNSPNNIIRMQWKDHWMLHSNLVAERHKVDSDYAKKISEGRKKFWSQKENRVKYSERISQKNRENWQDPEYRKRKIAYLKEMNKLYYNSHPELKEILSKRATNTLQRLWKDPKYKQLFHEKIVAANQKRITNNTGKVKFLKICKEAIEQYGVLNPETFEKARNKIYSYGSSTSWEIGLNKYFSRDKNRILVEVNANHKVVTVEFLTERQDVYDLTVEGTHNFALSAGVFVHNSIDGDAAAAMRYTEARLSKIAEEILNDIEKETVDFVPNYNEEMQEPVVLPSKIPNLLLNGSTGIAVGMATNIPPHNLGELCDAIVYLVDHPDCSLQDLLEIVKGPDFPTAAIVSGGTALARAYASGRGSIVVTSRTVVEEVAGRTLIVVKEIPYMISKAQLLEELALQVKNGRVEHVSDVRDESDRDGIRIVIILTKDANPDVVRNQLFTHTRLRTTFGINMVVLVNGEPLTLGLKQTLHYFIAHRKIVVTRRAQYDLRQAQEREHKLKGLVIALDNIDAVVALIKKSRSTEEAAQGLCAAFSLSELQAKTVLEMRLQRLTSLERTKIRDELVEVHTLITALETLLSSDSTIFSEIKKETIEVKNLYANARRTEITIAEDEDLDIADLIEEGRVVVTLTQDGYVKRVPLETYRAQGRGGKGIIGAGKKEEDVVRDVFVASTHDILLCFTNKGVVHWLKVYQIPEGQRHARGKAVVNLLQLREGETVAALIPIHEFSQDNFIFFVTRCGLVKKTPEFFYAKPRQGGIIALGLEEGDSLVEVFVTNGRKDIILATSAGMAIRFSETDVRAMGRTAHGVYGISLRDGESVIGAVACDEESQDILTVTERGYGKRTSVSDYRKIRRSGRGVINIKQSERNGKVCALLAVRSEENVILISTQGILIQMPVKEISCIGRNTQGVRLMSLHEGDSVVAAARVVEEQELDHHNQNNQEQTEGGMTMKKATKYDAGSGRGKESKGDEKGYPDEKDLEEEDAELEEEVDSDVLTAEEEGFEKGYLTDEEKSFSGKNKKEEKKAGKSAQDDEDAE